MAIVPDLSGNAPFPPDEHIANSSGDGATSALQVDGNNILSSINGDTTSILGAVDGVEALIAATNTKLDTLNGYASSTAPVTVTVDGDDHEPVAASQTDQMCGTTGAAGDILRGLWIVPATLSPGGVSIEEGSTNTVVFTGGASSVSNLVPFWVELNLTSSLGGWEITTGANVSVIAVGKFT